MSPSLESARTTRDRGLSDTFLGTVGVETAVDNVEDNVVILCGVTGVPQQNVLSVLFKENGCIYSRCTSPNGGESDCQKR